MEGLQKLANELDNAAKEAKATEQLSNKHDYDLSDAYMIQRLSLDNRYQRGEVLVGLKMGFTSLAKMEQMGVHDMIWGRLTDKMAIPNEGLLPLENFIHPRAEPELCYHVAKDIDREILEDEFFEYFDGVASAIEIIDSRYLNFKFSLEDVIADNCSSSGFIIGAWHDVKMDVSNLSIKLQVDNETVQEGSSNAILGDPRKSILAATRLASQYRQPIRKGSIILAGAATAAVYIQKGQKISVEVENLGRLSFGVV